MISAFGIDHGTVVSKADQKQPKASFGRHLTAQTFPGWHGAVAGKKGSKGKAFASEAVPAVGGSIAGGALGAGLGALTRSPAGVAAGGVAGSAIAGRTGIALGVKHAQKKGYFKPQKKS